MDIYNTDYRNKPFDINKQLQILYNEQIATIFPIYEPKRGVVDNTKIQFLLQKKKLI